MSPLFGSLETGGTSCACAVGDGLGGLERFVQFDTTTPEDTLERAAHFFSSTPELSGLGVAAFGPLDLDERSPRFGHVLNTPKPGWSGADLVGPLSRLTGGPVAIDTDVGAAAYGEWRFGAAQDDYSVLYVTVGTGIGGGLIVDGRPLHGAPHPEMGHIRVPRHPNDAFPGACPHHGDCLEGMASGAAIAARVGRAARDLPNTHPVWETVAHYVGHALASFALTLAPSRIVLGGGISLRDDVLARSRQVMGETLGGYPEHKTLGNLDTYVVRPALGARSGLIGAMAMARAVYAAGSADERTQVEAAPRATTLRGSRAA